MLISAAPRIGLRRGLVALAAAILVAALPARADDLQDATKLLKAGQHQQALERVNKLLSSKPRDPQARFLKGLILTEQGNTREAIDIFSKLTQDFPELPEPYNNLAVIYASQGQYEKARTALEQSIRTHPSYATAYENLGDVYTKLASQAYGKALGISFHDTTKYTDDVAVLYAEKQVVGDTNKAFAILQNLAEKLLVFVQQPSTQVL